MENSKKTKEDFEQLFEKALNMIQWTKKSEGTQERALYILLYYVLNVIMLFLNPRLTKACLVKFTTASPCHNPLKECDFLFKI